MVSRTVRLQPLAIGLTLAAAIAGCHDQGDRPTGPIDPRPNIVLIVVDDLGWDDFGDSTAPDLRTPHLDALAENGTRFTSAYSPAPLCSPARAGMITGRFPQRFGHEHNTGSIGRQHDQRIGLPRTELTLADQLRSTGYATGMIGKWHLGAARQFHPMQRGFDEFFGFLPGHHPYHQWSEKSHNPILRGYDPVRGDEYLTDAFSREAVDFIERHAGAPFFLMLAYSAVHDPLVAHPARLERMAHLPDGPRREFAAVLAAVDEGVGQLMHSLERSGIEDRTLVLFTSDNGARGASPTLRGDKGSLYEAGIRVPLLAHWPDEIPAGARYADPVSTLDAFATAVALAGVAHVDTTGPIDGIDLLPAARGEIESVDRKLYWRMAEQHAMREGRWKLHWQAGQPPTLHDLLIDPAETRDRAREHPERVRQMQADYARWESVLEPPRWQWLPGQPPRPQGISNALGVE